MPRLFAPGVVLLSIVGARQAGAQAIILDSYCSSIGMPLHRDGTTDDSNCVAQAATYASQHNQALYVPTGGPILLNGSSQVTLNNLKLFGDSWQDKGNSSGQTGYEGAVFWLKDTTPNKSPFVIGFQSAEIDGINFYWPDQGSGSCANTPCPYPALFTAASAVQHFKMTRSNVINAYDFLNVGANQIGGVILDDDYIWAIHYALELQNVPEVFFISNSLFSLGVGNQAVSSSMATWYETYGAWLVVSGTGNGTNASSTIVSAMVVNTWVYGARYGIWVKGGSVSNPTAGRLQLSSFIGGGFDGVQTVLQADAGAYISTTIFAHQYWNAQNPNAPNSDIPTAAVWDRSLYTEISFDDLEGSVNGTAFNIAPGSFSIYRIRGSNVLYGATPGGTATYLFVEVPTGVSGTANFRIESNWLHANSGTGNGIKLVGGSLAQILGNTFTALSVPVEVDTTTTQVLITGNIFAGTTGSKDVTGSFGTNVKIGADNILDKP